MTVANLENWWLVRVTFERRAAGASELLPDHCQGAVGWMACRAQVSDSVRDRVEEALIAEGLRLVEVSEPQLANSLDQVEELDAHLAANVVALEPGKVVVWGTIWTYVGDGEA